jgi:hypothetical protein
MFIGLDDWSEWGANFATWLELRFSADVLYDFDPAHEDDWIAWLDQRQTDAEGRLVDCVDEFSNELKSRFQGVRVFHATRLSDIEAIRREGLRAWTSGDLTDLARRVVGPLTDEATLERAIATSKPKHRAGSNGRLYMFSSLGYALQSLDGSASGRLPSFSVHGSEFLRSVAKCAHDELSAPGRAYFLACDLPWSLLDPFMQNVLTRHTLQTAVICRHLDPGMYNMLGSYGSITTSLDVAAEHILLIADVEHLIGREDLRPSDIRWEPFNH